MEIQRTAETLVEVEAKAPVDTLRERIAEEFDTLF